MIVGETPISLQSADCVFNACSPAASGERAHFEQSLAQAASSQAIAPSVADRAAVAPPVSEVQRASALDGTPGDRVLHALSIMHRSRAGPPAVSGAPSAPGGVQGAAAVQPLVQVDDVGAHAAGKPIGSDFDSMMVSLRDVYRDVVQVSLVSKSTSAVGSSLNKLLSAG